MDILLQAKEKIALVRSIEELHALKTELLGKQSPLSMALRQLAHLSTEEKKIEGPRLNRLKEEILLQCQEKEKALEELHWQERLRHETIDVTRPAPEAWQGCFHPLTQALSEITQIFINMGFSVCQGPDIETSFYNFDALNVPPEHPARTMQDTIYLEDTGYLMRTQTSPIQIRTMEQQTPPLRIISSGRCYRADAPDRTHTPMFHQIEGLVVEKDINMGHLKGCIQEFLQKFLGFTFEMRLRPSFFPFTEPSAEVDIRPKNKDWLEVLGCGMVNQKVFKNCKQEGHTGFAFGMGIERMAMIKYGIEDIRSFYQNDQRWLQHYGFSRSTPGL